GVRAAAAVHRDIPDAGGARCVHRLALRAAVHLGHRRKELSAAARIGDDRHLGVLDYWDTDLAGDVLAMVAGHGGLEWSAGASSLCAEPYAARVARCAARAEQAMPQLPRARR